MNLADLSLTSIKLCSPVIVFIVYVIVSGVSLYMSRNVLKRFNSQRMENLYNLYSWSEVKLVIVLGVVIYGLCQYDQMNLAWVFLLLPVIYIMLNNLIVYYNVSNAHQNAPKDNNDLIKQIMEVPPSDEGVVYPKPPIVKKEVDTSIFGIRGDPDDSQERPPTVSIQSTPPSMTGVSSTPIDTIEGWGQDTGVGGSPAQWP